MYVVAFTPNVAPANALSAKHKTLIGAIGELLKTLDVLECDEWFVAAVLEAAKEAVDNLENCKDAKGAWSDMGCEDDAFSIDIFHADDARYIRFGNDDLIAPHGAVGLAIGEHNHQEWIYDEADIAEWDEVLLPKAIEPDCICSDTDSFCPIHNGKGVEAESADPIAAHNEPLRAAMFARGCEWKVIHSTVIHSTEHFTKDGKYEPFPLGYIRGPHYRDQGNPQPHQYSVQGHNGWLIMGFTNLPEARKWALKAAETVLSEVPSQS